MTISRRVFAGAVAAGALAAAASRPGRAEAKFTLKIGSDVPATHSMTIRTREAAARILADTRGEVDVGQILERSGAVQTPGSRVTVVRRANISMLKSNCEA